MRSFAILLARLGLIVHGFQWHGLYIYIYIYIYRDLHDDDVMQVTVTCPRRINLQ